MASNPNITELDASMIGRRTYDSDNDAVRVSMGAAEFVVSGDGASANGSMTLSSSGQVIAATDCSGTKEFQLYAVATTLTTGSISVRLDVSPDSTLGTGVWYQTTETLTLGSSAANTVAVSTILNSIIAKQMRVTITANTLIAGEHVTVYVVGNTF